MSGLILLVIVGAWLAVLVPMALRSHDAASATKTVDKFHDAMRVLSRREAVVPEPVVAQKLIRAPKFAATKAVLSKRPVGRPVASPARALAARRRRVLLVLVVAALALFVGAGLGPRWLLAPGFALSVVVVAYLVQLRRQAVRRVERDWQRALGERVPQRTVRPAEPARTASSATNSARTAESASVRHPIRYATPAHVVGVPSRMPSRMVVDPSWVAPEALAAASSAKARPRGAQGAPWQPVPVPAPIYLSAATAPRRVLDLTRVAQYTDGITAAERDLGIDDQGPDLEEILEPRRTAGGW